MDLFERELNSIKTWYAMKLEEIDRLRKENEKLKQSHYKDEELQRLQTLNEELTARCSRFGLSEESYKKLMDWWENHLQTKHKRALKRYEQKMPYKYVPVPGYKLEITDFIIDSKYTILCEKCKKSFSVID